MRRVDTIAGVCEAMETGWVGWLIDCDTTWEIGTPPSHITHMCCMLATV